MWIKQLLSSYEVQRPAGNDQELKGRNLEKLGNGTATDGDIFSLSFSSFNNGFTSGFYSIVRSTEKYKYLCQIS